MPAWYFRTQFLITFVVVTKGKIHLDLNYFLSYVLQNGGIQTGVESKYDSRDEYQMAPLKFSSPCVKGILCPQGMLIKVQKLAL